MAIKWDKFVRRDRGTLLFGGIICLALALTSLFFYFNKEKIKSKDDITFISGQFKEYTWVDMGGRNGSSLTFTFQNYSNRFKIKADFFSILLKEKFKVIPFGETLTVGIPNSHVKFLNTIKESIFVYSIVSKDHTYLDLKNTISKHNTLLFLLSAVLFGIGSYFFIYFGRKAKVKTLIW